MVFWNPPSGSKNWLTLFLWRAVLQLNLLVSTISMASVHLITCDPVMDLQCAMYHNNKPICVASKMGHFHTAAIQWISSYYLFDVFCICVSYNMQHLGTWNAVDILQEINKLHSEGDGLFPSYAMSLCHCLSFNFSELHDTDRCS